jgi:hypothetical protein
MEKKKRTKKKIKKRKKQNKAFVVQNSKSGGHVININHTGHPRMFVICKIECKKSLQQQTNWYHVVVRLQHALMQEHKIGY